MSMHQPNPHASSADPRTQVAHGLARHDVRLPRLVFCALVALQFLATLVYGGVFYDLTRTGGVHFLSFVAAVTGSACLYGATAFVALGRARGFIGFAVAAALLASSLRLWSLAYPWGRVIACGAVLAVLGVLLVRGMKGFARECVADHLQR